MSFSLRHRLGIRITPRLVTLFVLLIAVLSATGVPSELESPRTGQVHAWLRATDGDAGTNLGHLNHSPRTWLTADAGEPMDAPVLSLRTACAEELAQHCPTTAGLRCLLDTWASLPAAHRDSAQFTATCSQWLVARDACFSALQQIGSALCRDAPHGRECLRRVPRILLPTKCVDSDYFRSVMLLDAMKR